MRVLQNVLCMAVCLILVSAVAEEQFKPLPILDAEALINTGKFSEAKAELDSFVTDNAGSEWKALAQFLSLRCDYEGQNFASFHAGVVTLKSASPSHPYMPDLLLFEGRAYQKEKSSEQALACWRELIANFPSSKQVPAAQEELVQELYSQKRFTELFQEVEAIRASAPAHPAVGDFTYLEGDACLMLHDLAGAKGKLQQVTTQHATAKNYEKAVTLLQVTELLQQVAANPEQNGYATELQDLLKRRMIISEKGTGLSEKTIFDRVYEQAKNWQALGNTAAARRGFEMVAECDYLGYLKDRAALDLAQLDGDAQKVAEKTAVLDQAEAAKALYLDAIEKRRGGKYDESVALLEQLVERFPKTERARDAMLRKGYVLIAAGRKPDAARAFRDALAYNSDLPPDHNFNVEARTRLAALKHSEYYTHEYPEKSPNLQPILTNCDALYNEVAAALPADAPERAHVAMQRAGLAFELARSSGATSATWEQVRSDLGAALADGGGSSSQQTRALVELMYMETFFVQGRYDEAIQFCEQFETKYKNLPREYGTALATKSVCYWRKGDLENLEKTYRRMKDEFSDDVEWFATQHVKQTGELWSVNLYFKEGKWMDGLAYLDTILKKYPDTLQTKRVLETRQRGTCDWP